MTLVGTRAMRRAAMTAGAVAALCCPAVLAAPVAGASPSDDNYLAAIEANGVPIVGEAYVIGLGHAVCDTARQYPSMQITDLVLSDVSNENLPSPYSFDQGKVIVTSALANYCPDSATELEPVPPPIVAPAPTVETPYVPPVPVPTADVPNLGCTWVNGYTKKNGTNVRGHYRC